VLCVDPEGQPAPLFADRDGFAVVTAASVAAARDAAAERPVDCVVAEYDLPDGTGFDLFEAVREHSPNAGCVLYTDVSHEEIDPGAVRDAVAEYLPKGGRNAGERLVETVELIVDDRTQVGFPLPSDEDERLETLRAYDIEGYQAVEAFDRLSTLVANHFDIRIAFIGLIGEREERFVACHGADWQRLEREDSICTYAILEEAVTVVEDVREDPRFEHNEALEARDIRSYAGANITAPDGQVVGELCLIDDEPRTYTERERADLQLFADEVAEQFEFRRRLGALERDGEVAADGGGGTAAGSSEGGETTTDGSEDGPPDGGTGG